MKTGLDKSIGNQKTVKPAGSDDRSMGGAPTLPPRDGARPNNDQSLGSVKTMSPGGPRPAGRRFCAGDVILRRYRVTEELGQGGMGVVYRCFDTVAGIDVALKALPPEVAHNSGEMEEVRANFRLVSKLHHPNIANVNTLERDTVSGDYYLIMECVDGYDVRQWVRRRREDGRPLTLDEVTIIAYRIAEALDYAHEQGVIHRDIKPSNVRVNFEGEVKVLDFGLAAQIQMSQSRVSQAAHGTSGTGPYMAPEQWRGQRQGTTADQYALAATVYELLGGSPPFENHDTAILREAVLKDAPLPLEDVPEHVNAALLRGLDKAPGQRFESCAEFVKALAGSRRQEASASVAPSDKGVTRQKKAGWLLAVGLAALAGVGYWVQTTHRMEPAGKVVAAANPAVSAMGDASAMQAQTPVVSAVSVGVGSSTPASSASESLRRGLILHFSFDNVQGDKVMDESGVGNHGILKGGKFVPGKVGNALLCTFANEIDGVLVKDNPTLNLDAVTMAAWIKTSRMDGENWARIMDKDFRTAYTFCMGGDYQGNSWRGKVGIESAHKACYSKGTVADGQWHFVVGSYNGRTFKLYIDSQLENVNTLPSHTPICQSGYDLMIGNTAVDYRPPDSIHNQFDGLLDEVRIYNRVLSDDEVLQLYELSNKLAAPAALSAIAADRPVSAPASSPIAIAVLRTGQPWTNSLGMVFVPVPGTAVLFSIWDTRVQDFSAFVNDRENNAGYDYRKGSVPNTWIPDGGWGERGWEYDWSNPGFAQTPLHPVVCTSWEDAKVFCAWLTTKERRDGRLSGQQSYRLPTDAEWSYAVGLGELEGNGTPIDKNMKLPDVYPWGTEWPPPNWAGNYSNAFREDGFDLCTSPVGSFTANRYGLYDMGGNVWQWCEDRFDPSQDKRVLRGMSWGGDATYKLCSSVRCAFPPEYRENFQGFRVVLADGAVSAPQVPTVSASTVAQPNNDRSWIIPTIPQSDSSGWVTLFDGEHLYGCDPNNEVFTSGKVYLEKGVLWMNDSCVWFNWKAHNAALRIRVKKISGQHVASWLGPYFGWFNGGKSFGISQWRDNHGTDFVSGKSKSRFQDFFDMEFTVVSGKLTLMANGATVATTQVTPLAGDELFWIRAFKGLGGVKRVEAKVLGE